MWFLFFIFSILEIAVPSSYTTGQAVYITNIIVYLFLMGSFILIAIIFVIGHWSKVSMTKRSGDTGTNRGNPPTAVTAVNANHGDNPHMKPSPSSNSVLLNMAHDTEMTHSTDQIKDASMNE